MSRSRGHKPLKKFAQAIESLDLNKQVAAAKWLEGVIVGQVLTKAEREDIVKASNEYVEAIKEAEYVDAVNALIRYLGRVRNSANRALKSLSKKRLAKARVRKAK